MPILATVQGGRNHIKNLIASEFFFYFLDFFLFFSFFKFFSFFLFSFFTFLVFFYLFHLFCFLPHLSHVEDQLLRKIVVDPHVRNTEISQGEGGQVSPELSFYQDSTGLLLILLFFLFPTGVVASITPCQHPC